MDEITRLDEAKEKLGSDYAVAKALNIAPQRLNNIRRGHTRMSPWIAARLAEVLGKDPMQAAVEVHAANAPNAQEQRDWRRWAGVAAVILTISGFCASAVPSTSYAGEFAPVIYIMRISSCCRSVACNRSCVDLLLPQLY